MVGIVANTLTIPSTPLAKENMINFCSTSYLKVLQAMRLYLPNKAAVVPDTPADEKISDA